MNFELEKLVRPNIWALEPYSCARDEFKGMDAHVFLDANESPYNDPINRYPDPLQEKLKQKLSHIKQVKPSQIFLGNGSDEAIDLVYRIFCEPGKDNVVAIAPTYGMYKVCADINNVKYRPVLLDEHYQIQAQKILDATDINTKVIWLCSPNNPTGNELDKKEMQRLLLEFNGIVVIDEAYSDFSGQQPFRHFLDRFPNLIVLNTFSKAWGCASIRLGMAFASEEIIGLFNKVKYPYNINKLTQDKAMQMLKTKLLLLKQEENAQIASGIRGEVSEIGWGNQIRSYVLQPYTMVKDLRTGEESGNTDAVLDGKITPFMNAYLKWLSLGCPDRGATDMN